MNTILSNAAATFAIGFLAVCLCCQGAHAAEPGGSPICSGAGGPAGIVGCNHNAPFCSQPKCDFWPVQTTNNPPPITGCSCQ
jgi:hypothetical protein